MLCRGGCGAVETLNHVLQKCGVTHDSRCARHNRLLRLLNKKLKGHGKETMLEPIIPAAGSYIKPDLIVKSKPRGTTTIIDVTVVAGGRLEESWHLKTTKYGSGVNAAAIQSWLGEGPDPVHTPVVVSSRGLLYGPSGRGLRNLGMSERDLMDLCMCTIQGSLNCYDCYMRDT